MGRRRVGHGMVGPDETLESPCMATPCHAPMNRDSLISTVLQTGEQIEVRHLNLK
jgi:hypothetical protein